MRVLHILNELKPSGAEVMLELAAPVWLKMGCELHILSISALAAAHEERMRAAGWIIDRASREGGVRQLISRVTAMIRQIQPDVVHLHQEGRSLPLCYAARRAGVPMVRTVHNNFPFTGRLRLRKAFERWLCRRMGSKHIAISPSVQANERARFHNPTELCWNWFDAGSFRPPSEGERSTARERLGLGAQQKVLVSIGNGSDTKNYRVVVEALAAMGHPNVHYYQVGHPHPHGVDEQLANDLGVASQVHLMGPRKDILDWLWACDAYLMPSIFEGYGLAAVEAIAAGCECVFADCPGLADFKEMAIHAAWVPPHTASFLTGIQAALLTPSEPSQLLSNAAIIREAFAVAPRARPYYDLWLSAVAHTAR